MKIGKKNVKVSRLLKFLSKERDKISSLLILTHDYPDPDALASAYALDFLLSEGFKVNSRIVYGGVIGRMENRAMVRILKMPVHKLKHSDFKKYGKIALVDTQPGFKNNSFPKRRKAFLVIDQHSPVEKPNADMACIDTECGATCVLLAQALIRLHLKIPPSLATALAYGIISDTQHLYRARREDVIETYLAILPFCDMQALAAIQNPARSAKFFITLSRGITEAKVRRRLIVSHLGEVATPDLVSQVADFLLTYKRMRWALCTGRYKGKLYVSLRIENSKLQADEILRDIFSDRFESGGHGTIAGGSFKVSPDLRDPVWEKTEEDLVQRFMRRVRIPLKGEYYTPFRQRKSG